MLFFKKIQAVRGAVCCENTASSIEKNISLLFKSLLEKNNIPEEDVVSVQFTVTSDLTELNPAAALRKSGFAQKTPLFCSAEPAIKNSLAHTVRILLYFYGRKTPCAVYLNGAETLRPDLFKKDKTQS